MRPRLPSSTMLDGSLLAEFNPPPLLMRSLNISASKVVGGFNSPRQEEKFIEDRLTKNQRFFVSLGLIEGAT